MIDFGGFSTIMGDVQVVSVDEEGSGTVPI